MGVQCDADIHRRLILSSTEPRSVTSTVMLCFSTILGLAITIPSPWKITIWCVVVLFHLISAVACVQDYHGCHARLHRLHNKWRHLGTTDYTSVTSLFVIPNHLSSTWYFRLHHPCIVAARIGKFTVGFENGTMTLIGLDWGIIVRNFFWSYNLLLVSSIMPFFGWLSSGFLFAGRTLHFAAPSS
jgi:hypothetical protein